MIKALLAMLIAVTMISSASLLSENASAEYAVCTGDCEAPTMGLLDSGRKIVDQGFTINNRSYEVAHFVQPVTTTMISTGETVTIRLTVHENTGVDAIRQISVSVADYVDDRNRNELATISFHQSFSGVRSVSVTDLNGMLRDISVNPVQLDQFRMSVEFSFKAAKPIEGSAIIVDAVDAERNSKRNVFLNALTVTGSPMPEAAPDVPRPILASPLQQVRGGVMPQNVECRSGLELVFRTSNGSPLCVYPFNAETLRGLGLVR